jgi:hypothetical protein
MPETTTIEPKRILSASVTAKHLRVSRPHLFQIRAPGEFFSRTICRMPAGFMISIGWRTWRPRSNTAAANIRGSSLDNARRIPETLAWPRGPNDGRAHIDCSVEFFLDFAIRT